MENNTQDTFGEWPKEIHSEEEQQRRMDRAASYDLTPLDVDKANRKALFLGSRGIYETSLYSCSCGDFIHCHKPCKHMYRLAHELGVFDLGRPVKVSKKTKQMGGHPEPEETKRSIRDEIREYIASVIDEQPQEHLPSVMNVLGAIGEADQSWAMKFAIKHLYSLLPEGEGGYDRRFEGKRFAATGELSKYTREEIGQLISLFGGTLTSSVSKKTSFVIVGKKAGSKLDKARALGIPVITEDDFEEMIS